MPRTLAEPTAAADTAHAVKGPPAPDRRPDRRATPRRRLRDRIASLDHTENPALRGRFELSNQLLLVEDDLRQTALVLGKVEKYLESAMSLLEDATLSPEALAAHAEDEAVLDEVDDLAENLANLRRRMSSIAMAIGTPPGGGGAAI